MASNPYQSPNAPEQPHKPAPLAGEKQPFSLQAAKFSLYAPFILFLINFCASSQLEFEDNADLQGQMRFAIGLIVVLTTLAAFVLGFVGVIGGIMRRAAGTIIIAVLGVLLNGLLIASTIALIVHLRGVAA